MVTQVEAETWLKAQLGKHLDYDHQYGQQCFDFFNFYFQYITGLGPYAEGYGVSGAKDIWTVPADAKFFAKIPDSNSLVPQPGDVMIYGASWGLGYGHVEVCLSSDANGSHLIGENEHSNPSEGVVEVYRTWAQMRGLLGVLRPHWTPAVAMINLAQLTQLYHDLLGRAPDSGGIAHYVGHYTYAFVENDIKNSTEYKTRQARLAAEAPKPAPVLPQPTNNVPQVSEPVVTITPPAPPQSLPVQTVTPVPAPKPAGQGSVQKANWFIRFLRWLIK